MFSRQKVKSAVGVIMGDLVNRALHGVRIGMRVHSNFHHAFYHVLPVSIVNIHENFVNYLR